MENLKTNKMTLRKKAVLLTALFIIGLLSILVLVLYFWNINPLLTACVILHTATGAFIVEILLRCFLNGIFESIRILK